MTKDCSRASQAEALVTSPGSGRGPFPKEVRFKLTEQQHAYLETAKGHGSLASYIRDRLFYASPDEVQVIGAIGSIYQVAGRVIGAAQEVMVQLTKLELTIASIAAIVEHQSGVAWPELPKHVSHAIQPVREQADRLLALGLNFEDLARDGGVAELRRVLDEKPQPDIEPRPRRKR